jgi:5-methylcytosine-specific restriction endonuclease McrA
LVRVQYEWNRRNGPKSASARLKLKREMYKECGGLCYWCGEKMNFPVKRAPRSPTQRLDCTFEHIIPYSEGGKFTPGDNIALAHAKCNHERHKPKNARVPPTAWKLFKKFCTHDTYRRFILKKYYWRVKSRVYVTLWDCWPNGYRKSSIRERKSTRLFWKHLRGRQRIPGYYLVRARLEKRPDVRGSRKKTSRVRVQATSEVSVDSPAV